MKEQGNFARKGKETRQREGSRKTRRRKRKEEM